jgi:inorganic pyrophosphatase
LHDATTAPGLVLKCKIIGVLEVLQSAKGKKAIRNDRLIAVPRDSHREKADKDARPAQAGAPGDREVFRCDRRAERQAT